MSEYISKYERVRTMKAITIAKLRTGLFEFSQLLKLVEEYESDEVVDALYEVWDKMKRLMEETPSLKDVIRDEKDLLSRIQER